MHDALATGFADQYTRMACLLRGRHEGDDRTGRSYSFGLGRFAAPICCFMEISIYVGEANSSF